MSARTRTLSLVGRRWLSHKVEKRRLPNLLTHLEHNTNDGGHFYSFELYRFLFNYILYFTARYKLCCVSTLCDKQFLKLATCNIKTAYHILHIRHCRGHKIDINQAAFHPSHAGGGYFLTIEMSMNIPPYNISTPAGCDTRQFPIGVPPCPPRVTSSLKFRGAPAI